MVFFRPQNELNSIYLADNVPHLLCMDDVRGVDDCCVAGPVHLGSLLVLSLRQKKEFNLVYVHTLFSIHLHYL